MVTMKDVADVFGVSTMTVSNAFNRPDQLSPDLRSRILHRAEKMGYAGPNAAARALRHGRAHAYGVVFAEGLSRAFSDPFTVEWLAGFTEAMEENRASIVLLSVSADRAADLDVIRNVSVDGIAGMCASHPAMALARQQRLPVVAGDRVTGDFVAIDETAAAREVTAHLTALGHRRVCVVIGRSFPGQEAPVALTVDELRSTLARHAGTDFLARWERLSAVVDGLRGCRVEILVTPRFDRESAYESAGIVLDRADRPTAVVGLSDAVALGVADAMRDRGLLPGRDLSVTGFDDIPAAAAAGLTTIRQPIREKGRLAAGLLLRPDQSPRQVVCPHSLVVRSSTGPAPHLRPTSQEKT